MISLGKPRLALARDGSYTSLVRCGRVLGILVEGQAYMVIPFSDPGLRFSSCGGLCVCVLIDGVPARACRHEFEEIA